MTFIVFEFPHKVLSVWPHISSLAIFPSSGEHPEEKTSIRPLKQSFTMHRVLNKRSLVDFAPRSDTPTPAINLAFVKLTFKHRVVWEYLKAKAVWLGAFCAYLAPILGAALAFIPITAQDPLCADLLFLVIMFKMIKRA